jgi:hypothetical protein
MASGKFTKTLSLVAIVVAAALLGVTILASNPLRKSQTNLRAWILKQAPLGSSVSDVKAVIKSHGWAIVAEWRGKPSETSSESASFKDYPGVKGEYFIQANLGRYQGVPFPITVDAHWGFDSTGRLVDLRIRKIANGI